jgi:hypothetical protein
LRPFGGRVPDWFNLITLMRHIGTDDEHWFDKRAPIWGDWVAIHADVVAAVERGPEQVNG